MKVNGDNFCEITKYKLYRNVYEILHPTISKKNISNYKVVFDEKLLPTLVFYPKKVSNMKSVIIMVPGLGQVSNSFGKYSDICKRIAIESEKLVVAIDYFGTNIKYPTTNNKVFKIINYLYDEFEKNGIDNKNIILMSDSTGCSILGSCLLRLKKKKKEFNKMIMLYPVCRNDYSDYCWNEKCLSVNFNLDRKVNNYLKRYFSKNYINVNSLFDLEVFEDFPDTLIVTGEMDILKEDGLLLADKLGANYENVNFASHGFLGCCDEEILIEAHKKIVDFII